MRKREVTIYTLFIIAVSLATVHIVLGALTGRGVQRFLPLPEHVSSDKGSISQLGTCTDLPPANLQQVQDPHLQKLHRYQAACQSHAVNRLMIFTDMPKDNIEARDKAIAMAAALKEFKQHNITPLVIVEPASEWGLIDFTEFDSGFYDGWIRTYFATLHNEGITDADMGVWVPFPEANLPLWNNHNTAPADFARVVNRYLRLLKGTFPNTQASILLNSATYETSDFDWQNGEYVSLIPYVQNLDKALVNSIGIQGFPWLPPATRTGPGIVDPGQYLNPRLLAEAAETLQVKEVWFNTGTFGTKYTLDPEQTIAVPAAKREDLLNRTITEALKMKQQDYTVWVNIFAEDKSEAAEATDWSYLPRDGSEHADETIVLTNFIRRATDRGLNVSLFDR